MKKKASSIQTLFLRYYLILFVTLCYSCSSSQRTFYMDSNNGDDSNNGKSPDQAWKSLNKLNTHVFKPGDHIFFKSETEYIGQFEPKGSGSQAQPIMIDKYGEGANPILHGKGQKQHTILLEGLEYWELNNLEVTNLGDAPDPGRNGIIIYAWDKGDIHHIHLKNLTIRDVNGSCIKNDGGGNGIYWHNGGEATPTRFIDLLIENCHIYNCQRNGITGNGNIHRDKWYPSLQVVIRGNLIEQVPGDGIVPIACDGAVVEHNIVRDSPDLLRFEDAAAGIWPWSCDNTTIQYNEVSGQNAKWDGQGFDADYNCRNTLIQYNFSHDNAGGFIMVCNEGNSLGESYNIGTENTVIKHNVSINDGLRAYPTRPGWFSPIIHISGPAKNTLLEENLMIILKKSSPLIDRSILVMDNWGGPYPENTTFHKNMFYVINDSLDYTFNIGNSKQTLFKNNYYFGAFNEAPDDWRNSSEGVKLTPEFSFQHKFPKELQKRISERIHNLFQELQ